MAHIASENNRIYRKLFDSSNAAMLIIGKDFKIIDCNETAASILGRPRHEIIGLTPVDERITPEYQEYGKRSADLGPGYFSSAMEGKDVKFEWLHVKKDGTIFPVEISLFGFQASSRKNFFAVWRDLTEVQEKERELKESEERFRAIFLKGTDGVILHAPDITIGITHCNEAAYKILGYNSEQELIGKNILDISPEFQPDGSKTAEIGKEHLKDCLAKGQSRFEWIHLKKDGSPLWLDIVLTRISYLDTLYIHSIWRDITKVKFYQDELLKYQDHLEEMVKERTAELEEALKNLKDMQTKLIQSEKMASLGVLTAGVAHEINNPLNFIAGSYSGLVEYFERNSSDKELVSVLLNSLKAGVERATKIVNGLNQFSQARGSMDDYYEINVIIDNCLLILEGQVENWLEIERNYSSESIQCVGNIGNLHQVFLNILTNAIQSIEDKGTITISTHKSQDHVSIEITDNGCGISKENLSRISDPFFTTKDPGKGTGLGLSIAYSIIKDHNGTIEFTSEIKKGTTVRVVLPTGH